MNIQIATPADLARIESAAAANSHLALAPTHFLENDAGEVRGFFSAGGSTVTWFWSHTENPPIASIRLVKTAIAEAQKLGKPIFCPCTGDSPFAPLMPGFGFELLGHANIWRLKQ